MKKRLFLFGLLVSWAVSAAAADTTELLNASYDVSRELFAQINPAFASARQAQTGRAIAIRQSHGGSSKQARAVADGLQADVVTFNQVTDTQFLVKSRLVQPDWSSRLPNNEAVLARHRSEFPAIQLISVEETFGGWDQVGKMHFADGGVLDQLLGDRR